MAMQRVRRMKRANVRMKMMVPMVRRPAGVVVSWVFCYGGMQGRLPRN
jgi:hypothetical protein